MTDTSKKKILKSATGYCSQPEAALILGGSYSALRKYLATGKIKDHGWFNGRHMVNKAEVEKLSKFFKPQIKPGTIANGPKGSFIVPINIGGTDFKLLASVAAMKNMETIELLENLIKADAMLMREDIQSFVNDPIKAKMKAKAKPQSKAKLKAL